MKGIFISTVLCAVALSANANELKVGQTHTFMEANDLNLQDGMFMSNVSEEMFNLIVDTGTKLYKPFADKNKETLTINKLWDDTTVNANTQRMFGKVTINMYGGLARRPEVSPPAFALVMCHELGHAYGGTPYISSWQKMAAEGQADYYGAKVCLKKVIEALKSEFPTFDATPFIEKTCGNDEICSFGLYAGEGLGALLASMKKSAVPNYETPDPLVVTETVLSYPATVQCRLDTYLAGTMNLDRPKCWFAD